MLLGKRRDRPRGLRGETDFRNVLIMGMENLTLCLILNEKQLHMEQREAEKWLNFKRNDSA